VTEAIDAVKTVADGTAELRAVDRSDASTLATSQNVVRSGTPLE